MGKVIYLDFNKNNNDNSDNNIEWWTTEDYEEFYRESNKEHWYIDKDKNLRVEKTDK